MYEIYKPPTYAISYYDVFLFIVFQQHVLASNPVIWRVMF